MASIRRAEAFHHDLEELVPRIVRQHALDDADDIAAVLRYRIELAAASPPRGCRLAPRLIAGLIPAPLGEMSAEYRQSIDERAELIETWARALVAAAVEPMSPGVDAWERRPPNRTPGITGPRWQRPSPRIAIATRSIATCRSVVER